MPLEASRGALRTVGRYDLLEKIADGGMGSVYKARHRDTGDIVAIKIVPNSMLTNEILLQRFEREFHSASKIDHPNVVRALEYGHEGKTPYLVMEYVDGESLGQLLDREERLEEKKAIHIIVQAAQGLAKAHKENLVHRDVKPDNILITKDGMVKIADLGLVKQKDIDNELNLTRTGRGLGTPHFMAPEQFRDAKKADARCDVYSLGATLYMAVTGELPFRSCTPLDAWMKKCHNEFTPPREIVPTLSERIDWAIRRAMSADPDARPESCREFVEDLTGRSTRRMSVANASAVQHDLWYICYEDETGAEQIVKGTLTAIRKCLKDGLLGDADNVRVARIKAGPYEPLRTHPEFRDLVVSPQVLALPKRPSSSGRTGPKSPRSNQNEPTVRNRPMDLPRSPVYKAPTIDFGPANKPQTGNEWVTWLLVVTVVLISFGIGCWFFFLGH